MRKRLVGEGMHDSSAHKICKLVIACRPRVKDGVKEWGSGEGSGSPPPPPGGWMPPSFPPSPSHSHNPDRAKASQKLIDSTHLARASVG